jgi:hypothetical protein
VAGAGGGDRPADRELAAGGAIGALSFAIDRARTPGGGR